jgi:uncharacterized membrane protein YhaH (DUF805 family)
MGNLLFGFKGRISPSDFMKGAIVVIVISFILNIIPFFNFQIGQILGYLGIILVWPIVVLAIKRAHDAGKTGWMSLLPVVALLIGTMIMGMVLTPMIGGDVYADMQAAIEKATESGDFAAIMAVGKDFGPALAKQTAFPMAIASAVLMFIIAFGYNAMIKSDPEENRFGMPTN